MHTEAVAQTCSAKKDVLKNFPKFTGKYLCQSLFFNKVTGLRPGTLTKKRFWHRCFSVNFVKFLRTAFLQNTYRRLLLHRKIVNSMLSKYVWDNIVQKNHLCNIGPEHAAMILKENNLHNFVLSWLGQDCTKQYSLGKPIDSHWFKMSCLTCLVFSCVYCFFLKRWNYIKIFALHEYAALLPNSLFLTDWRHKRLKNTIDLLLFYREHFYGFSESE